MKPPAAGLFGYRKRRILIGDIQDRVCARYGIRQADMRSARRGRDVAWPRQTGMYLAKVLTPHSLPEIGREFNRDHTTVLHAIRAVEARRSADKNLDAEIRALVREIDGISTKNYSESAAQSEAQSSSAGA